MENKDSNTAYQINEIVREKNRTNKKTMADLDWESLFAEGYKKSQMQVQKHFSQNSFMGGSHAATVAN